MSVYLTILFSQPVLSTSVSPLSYLGEQCETTFQMSTVDLDDVLSILPGLDSAKATGCDGLPIRFMKVRPLEIGRLATDYGN